MKRIKRNKTNKTKLIFKILIFLLLIFVLNKAFFEVINFFSDNQISVNFPSSNILSNEKYATIKLDSNDNYSGIGQKNISNQDGYFTTFTDTVGKTYKEYKQNGSSSWADKKYWDGEMKDTGCGITAISIILSGYDFDVSPEDLRKKYYPVLNGELISKELSNTFGIDNSDFYYDSVHLNKKNITDHLKNNKPVLICVWNKPSENRWTTASHYMVLLASDDNDMIYVSNPNGLENNSKSSGWYNFDEVGPYIAKALYVYN